MRALSHVLHGPFTVPQAVWKRELVLAEGSRALPMTMQSRLKMIIALSKLFPTTRRRRLHRKKRGRSSFNLVRHRRATWAPKTQDRTSHYGCCGAPSHQTKPPVRLLQRRPRGPPCAPRTYPTRHKAPHAPSHKSRFDHAQT
jgi:hypothetical protein